MTKKLIFSLCMAISLVFLLSISSCNKKGCPANEQKTKIGKNGQLSTKKGKSNLFDKKMRKRIQR